MCEACESGDVEICAACEERARAGIGRGVLGTPELLERASSVWFARDDVPAFAPAPLALAPIVDGERPLWLAAGTDACFHLWDLDARSSTRLCPIPPGTIDLAEPLTLRVSRDGTLAAIAGTRGFTGAVVELATGATTLALARGDGDTVSGNFSIAFVERGDRTLVVHATDWDRLDISDARTGELLTARTRVDRDHAPGYFHCELHASPNGRRIADTGWVWHPFAIVSAWSVDRWLDDNVWESDDGESRRDFHGCDGDWDQPVAWLDDERVAVFGRIEKWAILPAASVYDATLGALLRWIYGPVGAFTFDRYLISIDETTGAAVWDVDTGHRLATCPELTHASYHPGAKVFLSGDAAWRVCGHHADAPWATPKVRALAEALRGDPANVAVLADALEEAGCDDEQLLAHCRSDHAHARRCWAVDTIR